MKSQIQKKKKKKKRKEKRESWNCGITNTVPTFFQTKLLMRGKKLFWAKQLWGDCSKLEDQ